jgi:DNA topoisomerase-1
MAYRHDQGLPLSPEDLARITRLRIPPAWRDVWICDDERGHLQATGRDAKGRKQYRYHDQWRITRDESKYAGLVAFGEALPKLREQVDQDLRRPALDRQRVLALAVAVLDETFIRVGNAQYARQNDSFGLTTLRDEHAEVLSTKVRLRFRGKSGKELTVASGNPRIARALRRARDLPGQELMQYLDEAGEPHIIESGDVNEYLQQIAEGSGSKDFRTWGGSLAAAMALHRAAPSPPAEKAVTGAIREAADLLGNTPAVCRRSYVHPGLLELYRSGGFEQAWEHAERTEPCRRYLREDERVFLGVLRQLAPHAVGLPTS